MAIGVVLADLEAEDPQTRLRAWAGLSQALQGESTGAQQEIKEACLKDLSQSQPRKAIHKLTCVVQVSPNKCSEIVQDEKLARSLGLALESENVDADTEKAFAVLCNAAASVPALRQTLKQWKAEEWCEQVSGRKSKGSSTRIACTVALVKLRFKEENSQNKMLEYTSTLLEASKSIPELRTHENGHLILEGLAILSLLQSARALIFDDPNFLDILLKPEMSAKTADDKSPQSNYSFANLLYNLTRYKPLLNAEESAAHKLGNLSLGGQSASIPAQSDGEIAWEENAVVDERNARLVAKGIMGALNVTSQSKSEQVRSIAGEAICSLARQPSLRGKLLQDGAAKSLLRIYALCKDESKASVLPACQALARLLISVNPLLALGPSSTSPHVVDGVRAISTLLVDANASLLQNFEGLLALTNLASVSEHARTVIVKTPKVMARVEQLMLDVPSDTSTSQVLCRRASTELITNVVVSEAGFVMFAGDTLGISEPVQAPLSLPIHTAQSRLHILLALCDVEDQKTRMAASGALATLTASPKVCAFVLSDKMNGRGLQIMQSLLEDDSNLCARGMACIANIVERLSLYDSASKDRLRHSTLQKALEHITKSDSEHSQSAKLMAQELGRI